MKNLSAGMKWALPSCLLVLVMLFAATPVNAQKTWSPVDGVTYTVEVFDDDQLSPNHIFNDIGTQIIDVFCYRPVKILVTVEVLDTAFDSPVETVQVLSFPGSPMPGMHPRSPWVRTVTADKLVDGVFTVSGEYWIMWRCSPCATGTTQVGAYSMFRTLDKDDEPQQQGNSGVTTVWDVFVQGECP